MSGEVDSDNDTSCHVCKNRRTKFYDKLNIYLCRKHTVDYEEADFWLDKWSKNNPLL